MDFIGEFFGYMAGILTAICFLPQTIKTIQTKEVRGLSAVSYSIYTVGIMSWIIYGFYLHSIPMILFNAVSFIFSATILYTIITQRGNKK